MKQFAHNWYLPCCQYTETCSNVSIQILYIYLHYIFDIYIHNFLIGWFCILNIIFFLTSTLVRPFSIDVVVVLSIYFYTLRTPYMQDIPCSHAREENNWLLPVKASTRGALSQQNYEHSGGHLVVCALTMQHTRMMSLIARQAKPGVHLVDKTRMCLVVNEHKNKCSCFNDTCLVL